MQFSVVKILPPALQEHDTIAFISPSARMNHGWSKALARAESFLVNRGYKVKTVFTPEDDFPTEHQSQIQTRVGEIHQAFSDLSVNAIICTLGGMHANELISSLDYELIKANPKIFVGYSDTTVLHNAIGSQTGLMTFYGPASITELGDYPEPMQFTISHLFHVISGVDRSGPGVFPRSNEFHNGFPDLELSSVPDAVAKPRTLESAPGWKWLKKGKATGRLVGGCLPVLLHLAGTRFWPRLDSSILILEYPMGAAFDEPTDLGKVREQLTNLINLQVFDALSGLVIGRPFACDPDTREKHAKLISEMLEGRNFPILIDVDVGHTSPMLTLPLGATCSLDSEKDEWKILEPVVEKRQ